MKRNILIISMLLCFVVLYTIKSMTLCGAVSRLATPESPVVWCKEPQALSIKWKKVKNAAGYRIYRYSKSKNKFVVVKTLTEKQTKWTDKKVKKHKVYKYKIAAYLKNKNGKKIFSKKTYEISARTYGKKAKIVNVDKIGGVKIEKSDETKEIGICSTGQLYSYLTNDIKVLNKKTQVVSKKIIWESSDSELIRVDKNGKITTFGKTGQVIISARAHNGAIGKIKINIVNYARPKSFQDYHGNIKELNSLLSDYKEEVCKIAEFFTIYNEEDKYGTITVNKNGEIIGIPVIRNISLIEKDIKKIINEYSYPVDIYFEKGYIQFQIGESITVEYDANNSYEGYPRRITSHWLANKVIGR